MAIHSRLCHVWALAARLLGDRDDDMEMDIASRLRLLPVLSAQAYPRVKVLPRQSVDAMG